MRGPSVDWQKYVPRLVAAGVLLVLGLGAMGAAATSMYTRIEPGEIGIIVNNITGGLETQKQPGIVYHLPFGMTDVYTIDSRLQVFRMTDEAAAPETPRNRVRGRERPAGASRGVKVKTKDGGDVSMNLMINYRIDPDQGEVIARRIGARKVRGPDGLEQDAYKAQLLRAYARSRLRDALGALSIVEISDPMVRNSKLAEVQRQLQDDVEPWGLIVDAVSATDFSFNEEYEELIRERKTVDQEMTNQAVAQETARREQETQLNAATRQKNVELRQKRGEMQKRIIEAQGLAEQTKKRAEGEAYRIKTRGDEKFAVAKAEAMAVEAEGLKKAEGIRRLSEAYENGGMTLVLEALAEKYRGTTIRGKPYNLDSTVERLRLEEAASGASRSQGAPTNPKGGSR